MYFYFKQKNSPDNNDSESEFFPSCYLHRIAIAFIAFISILYGRVY